MQITTRRRNGYKYEKFDISIRHLYNRSNICIIRDCIVREMRTWSIADQQCSVCVGVFDPINIWNADDAVSLLQ